jgi:uncharacterized ion transporter superfamily protein YfcC
MAKLVLIYLFIGLVFLIIYGVTKDEQRIPVMAAAFCAWPLFVISLIGEGLSTLLNPRNDSDKDTPET